MLGLKIGRGQTQENKKLQKNGFQISKFNTKYLQ